MAGKHGNPRGHLFFFQSQRIAARSVLTSLRLLCSTWFRFSTAPLYRRPDERGSCFLVAAARLFQVHPDLDRCSAFN
jgi:hypothetical protein